MKYQNTLDEIYTEVITLFGQGKVANYIPALANVEPNQFSMSITLIDGQQFNVGSHESSFSIQSISKVFSYTLALRSSNKSLDKKVWREPSGNPFNSLVQLEYEGGIPRNPFINAGAIVICDSLISTSSSQENALDKMLKLVKQCSNDPSITLNQSVAKSEMQSGFRNIALANLMKSFDNINNDVTDVLQNYFSQCAIEMNVQQLSRSFLFLANQGIDPVSKEKIISSSQAKKINSLMLTCGHYDASGDFAYRVGLPGKSGVGGGIVAVIPGKMAIAVYSPELNENGNSLIGTQALELFTTKTGVSIF
ncbi:MAG: glutaminase [Kangiella sp.]|nr:MAG: glutaminase [Kangiella sp.]